MKGVFSLEEALASLRSLNSVESPEHGWILICFPQAGGSLESLKSIESLENGLFLRVCKPWFPNRGPRFVTKQR